MTHRKRLPAPKHYPVERKEAKYVSTIEGSRSYDSAIPAVLVVRDVLGYADSEKEAKKIIRDQKLLRNGEPVRDIREGVGVLDVINLPDAEEDFRIVRDGKDLKFVPVTDGDRVAAKIVGKKVVNGDYVYRLHNGENHRTEKDYGTGNTLVFNSSVKEVELEEGAKVIVVDGQHAGEVAELKEIHERGMNPDTGRVESEHEFETKLENLVAIENLQVGEDE